MQTHEDEEQLCNLLGDHFYSPLVSESFIVNYAHVPTTTTGIACAATQQPPAAVVGNRFRTFNEYRN